jgi:hypothetical protein
MLPLRLLAGVAIATAVAIGAAPAAAATPTWQSVTGPADVGVQLNDVQAVSATSAWAVGIAYSSNQPAVAGSAVLEHWNGSTWSDVSGLPTADGLVNVDAVSDTNIYVSGYLDREFGATQVWHYDGAHWTALAETGVPATFTGRVLAAKGKVWLAGEVDADQPQHGAIIATFHGAASTGHWTVKRLATTGGFYGGKAVSATNVWAVGSTSQYPAAGRATVAHWNGKKWALTVTPFQGQLLDIAVDSSKNLMAVGVRHEVKGEIAPPYPAGIALHWNGKKWADSHLPCKIGCQLDTVAGGPSGSYWVSGHGPLEAKAATYLHFTGGHFQAPVNGPTLALTSSQREVKVLGLSRVPGTSLVLSVGFATSHTQRLISYQPLRESYLS